MGPLRLLQPSAIQQHTQPLPTHDPGSGTRAPHGSPAHRCRKMPPRQASPKRDCIYRAHQQHRRSYNEPRFFEHCRTEGLRSDQDPDVSRPTIGHLLRHFLKPARVFAPAVPGPNAISNSFRRRCRSVSCPQGTRSSLDRLNRLRTSNAPQPATHPNNTPRISARPGIEEVPQVCRTKRASATNADARVRLLHKGSRSHEYEQKAANRASNVRRPFIPGLRLNDCNNVFQNVPRVPPPSKSENNLRRPCSYCGRPPSIS